MLFLDHTAQRQKFKNKLKDIQYAGSRSVIYYIDGVQKKNIYVHNLS